MKTNGTGMTLRRFFSGIAEYVFQVEMGVVDPPLIDYLTDLLMRFVRNDQLYRVRSLSGVPVAQVAQMMAEAEQRIGDARRDVHRHIGDFTLFWAGLYPEALRHLRSSDKVDYFIDYCSQGKRAYHIASNIESSRENDPPGEVLHRLSSEYEMCAYGLREVRREMERRDDDDLPRAILLN
ncbi:MAG: hypothetical protein R3C99_17210 [Pirellulaceae bacterium]|nr:hypothetical protein [Planctomycetales bacterium]MCA9162932.1 hypothetical protein [Planctomycetales bacterium]MCA9202544.1 hypothetical protein [Planctomycetales bacterium]MCA9208554.1 hypothetical protein [Planctomycetales bacterium]MCA9219621.1 hypothetical protein [Planctomycetales bacterium]